MEQFFLNEVIEKLEDPNLEGFEYVKKYLDTLGKYHSLLGGGAACAVWKLNYHGRAYWYNYFMNNSRFNLDNINLDALMDSNDMIDSKTVDFGPYKYSSEFGLAHIISIPLQINSENEQLFDIKAVIIMISAGTINLSKESLQLIRTLLINRKPVTLQSPNVIKAISIIAGDNMNIGRLSLKHKHHTLNKALEVLSEKGKDHQPGLKHFSFWSFDSMEMILASKEFNKNTLGGDRYLNTNSILEGGDHYVYQFMKWLKGIINEKPRIEDTVWLIDFGEAKNCIKSEEYFKKIDITVDDSVILIFPIFFETYVSVCCLYVKEVFFTPFLSKTLFKILSDSIKQRITLVNEITIKNMLSSMMDKVSIATSHMELYKETAKILSKTHEADDCLIYLKDDYNDRFVLVTNENDNDISTYTPPNVEDSDFCFWIPERYLADTKFMTALRRNLKNDGQGFIYENNTSKIIRTACMTSITDTKKEYFGFILLLNKKHDIVSEGTFFHHAFFYNNMYVAKACSQFLILYRLLEFSINRKNMLLKKYRHEMPTCIDVIDTNIRIIRERYKEPVFRIKVLEKLANQLLLNCERIDMFATLFSSIDYDDEKLLGKPSEFNLLDFILKNLNSFKTEAAWQGVTIRYDIGIDTPTQYVSLFYQLSIANLITNAVRYAMPGTCIWIRSDSEGIEVSNLGIPILKKEKSAIFKEGYRGIHARMTDQKGTGFGLFFAKRIIELHGQNIIVTCDEVDSTNYFAEYMVFQGIRRMDKDVANAFIYNKVIAGDVPQASKLFIEIQSALNHIPNEFRKYVNSDADNIDIWMEYKRNYGPSFLIMDKNIFKKAIYKVTFKIEF